MSDTRTKPFLRVVIWKIKSGFAVCGLRRGPTLERIGNVHPTIEQAREAARFVPRKHQQIGFNNASGYI
jgi:hypothetical protein